MSRPGVLVIRVQFANFETEANYDRVNVYNATRGFQTSYSDDLGMFWIGWVAGDTFEVRFISDGDGNY
ncbi:MAG: hypothetical protein RBG13Loki_2148, partial [Promethearchaeota archaeon CR_4]